MKIFFVLMIFTFGAAAVNAQQIEFSKVFAESVMSSERVVKNAPFSGDAISESVQTLGDGNRIVRRTTSRLFRDGEGRYRREDMPKQLGLPGAAIDMPQSIFILDPVAGFRYTLNPKDNTARKSPFRNVFELKMRSDFDYKLKSELEKTKIYAARAAKESTAAAGQSTSQNENSELLKQKLAEKAKRDAERSQLMATRKEELEKRIQERANEAKTVPSGVTFSSKYETKNEDLGTQNIEGVPAEGTRSTTTIPAGAVGNERPIDIVYEKWYSKDLQLIVVSKHNDPRIGEQTYRLTNIRRDEPAASLFTPGPEYKVIESGPQPRAVVMMKPATPGVKAVTVVNVAPSAKPIPAPAAKPVGPGKPQN